MINTNHRIAFLVAVKSLLHNNIDAVEIGVLNGDFSQKILDILKPSTLVLVDPFEENEIKYQCESFTTAYSNDSHLEIVNNRFREEIIDYRVMVHKAFSYDAAKEYADDLFDFIYHDASHLYEDLKRDLNEWFPKLTYNGLMCGHDYGGIFKGVKKAVDEFCNEHNFEMIILNQNGGDFALRSNNDK